MADVVPIGTKRRRYTKHQKVTAVIAASMSSVTAAAEQAGIPMTTLAYWFNEPEFVELRTKTREDLADESKALAHKALKAINARLAEFEPRDLTILYGVLTDKAQLLSGQATARTETITGGMNDHEKAALHALLREAIAEPA